MEDLQSPAKVRVKLLANHTHAGVQYAPGAVLLVSPSTAATLESWRVGQIESEPAPLPSTQEDTTVSERVTQEDSEAKTGVLAASATPPRVRFSRKTNP